MIVGAGHDHTLDWWALGVLLYEMIIGIPPFYNKNKHQMYYLIQNAPVRWPERDRHGFEVSLEARDLLSRMLEKDRKKRLGATYDVQEILSHTFFQGLDLEKLKRKELVPPFVPKIVSDQDLEALAMKSHPISESIVSEDKI
jgi:serine/threonine protein kinase